MPASQFVPTISPTADQLRAWGLDPSWSQRVQVRTADGARVDWHVLDTGPGPRGTVVCVHGNPSWGYLWRDVLTTLSPQWRVIAVDQTNMGYSERTGPRRLQQRVDELVEFCRTNTEGPIILVAHDWGGAVATGALAHLDVRAVVLTNTAVAKPDGVRVPPLIALARTLSGPTCRATPLFVRGAAHMTRREHRAALLAPYRAASRRGGIADFVDDIPVRPGDPSFTALSRSADALAAFAGPVLLAWGGRDVVFNDRFLADLRRRVPHAQVQRFARASHYLALDVAIGDLVRTWLDELDVPQFADATFSTDEPPGTLRPTTSDSDRVVYVGPDGTITHAVLDARADVAASVLREGGLRRGDRVSVLIAPSVELAVATIAIWKVGAVPVVADASGGIAQLRRAVRASAPRFVIGTKRTLAAAAVAGFAPGARRAGFWPGPGVMDLRTRVGPPVAPHVARPDELAVVVHTSGATGPAKPVTYTYRQLDALRAALASIGLHRGDCFTTSFGAFMLLAPVLDMTCVRPDFDIDEPSEMGFDQLRDALAVAPVRTAWLSPAAANAIVDTCAGRTVDLDLVMVAGAPVSPDLATRIAEVTTAQVRTPYGMTECLPVTDGVDFSLPGPLGGYCVGRAVPGCRVRIGDLDVPAREVVADGQWGEIQVHAAWMFDGYDADWRRNHDDELWVAGVRYHRTGDVGYVHDGHLFHLGRLAHVIESATGPRASVAIEGPIRDAMRREVAAVGVGPPGAQVTCIVVAADHALRLAKDATRARVRSASGTHIAAVLEGRLPVDHRHQSKVNRSLLRDQVTAFLSGR